MSKLSIFFDDIFFWLTIVIYITQKSKNLNEFENYEQKKFQIFFLNVSKKVFKLMQCGFEYFYQKNAK